MCLFLIPSEDKVLLSNFLYIHSQVVAGHPEESKRLSLAAQCVKQFSLELSELHLR
jgi:hypothetical protein